jgi:hypothetical protein
MVEKLDSVQENILSIHLPGLEQGVLLSDLPAYIRGFVRINPNQNRPQI